MISSHLVSYHVCWFIFIYICIYIWTKYTRASALIAVNRMWCCHYGYLSGGSYVRSSLYLYLYMRLSDKKTLSVGLVIQRICCDCIVHGHRSKLHIKITGNEYDPIQLRLFTSPEWLAFWIKYHHCNWHFSTCNISHGICTWVCHLQSCWGCGCIISICGWT